MGCPRSRPEHDNVLVGRPGFAATEARSAERVRSCEAAVSRLASPASGSGPWTFDPARETSRPLDTAPTRVPLVNRPVSRGARAARARGRFEARRRLLPRRAVPGRPASRRPSRRPDPVARRLTDRVRQEDEPDGSVAASEVATRLVVGLDPPEPEPIPGGRRTPIQVEKPETEPPALERDARELRVELAPAQERRLGAPPRFVEAEERPEVVGESRRVIAQAEREAVVAGEPPLPPADLLAEVRTPSGQVGLPAVERQRRAGFPADDVPAELGAPRIPAGQKLCEEQVEPRPRHDLCDRAGCGGAVACRADGPQLIGRAVPQEAGDAYGSLQRQVEREDRRQPASRVATGVEEERPFVPALPPPGRGPLPAREDVPARLGEAGPLVPKRVERRDRLDVQRLGARRLRACAHRRSMAATRDASGTRRASRRPWVATTQDAVPAGDGA